MNQGEFIGYMGELAQKDWKMTKILPSLTIAQGILESGWGKSDLAVTGKNLFGMKVSSTWSGKVYNATTKECYDGENLVEGSACFKAYNHWEESISDHSALFTQNKRYEKVVGETDYKTACQEVKNAGYATDPDYVTKLISLIEGYELYVFDTKIVERDDFMSNSSLISGAILSPNKSVRTNVISKIAIHCMAGNLSAESCGKLFEKSTTAASSHYGIGADGVIFMYVNEADRAWCTGGTKTFHGKKGSEIDHMAVTIEVANTVATEPWPVSDKAFEKLIDLVEDIARRNGLTEVTYHEDGSGTLQAHRWYAAKACPGDYLMERFPEIARVVTERLGEKREESGGFEPDSQFKVRVTDESLNIRSGAGTDFPVVSVIEDCGVYTIMEVSGSWGRLKSGVGWIHLGYTKQV